MTEQVIAPVLYLTQTYTLIDYEGNFIKKVGCHYSYPFMIEHDGKFYVRFQTPNGVFYQITDGPVRGFDLREGDIQYERR